MMPRGLAPLLALVLLSACATKPPAPPPVAAAPPPPPPLSAYDGGYRGTRTLTATKDTHARCGRETNTAAIHVHNGIAILRMVPDRHPIVFHAHITPDGALQSSFKGNTVDGRFGQLGFDGTVETKFCVYSVHAERS
jgi:hypothetical protein